MDLKDKNHRSEEARYRGVFRNTSTSRFFVFLVLFVFPLDYQRFLLHFPQTINVDWMNFPFSQAFVFSYAENQHFAAYFPPGFSTRVMRDIDGILVEPPRMSFPLS